MTIAPLMRLITKMTKTRILPRIVMIHPPERHDSPCSLCPGTEWEPSPEWTITFVRFCFPQRTGWDYGKVACPCQHQLLGSFLPNNIFLSLAAQGGVPRRPRLLQL